MRLSPRPAPPRAVVLMYHAVGADALPRTERRYQVPTAAFRAHLERIARRCAVRGLAEMHERPAAGGPPTACLTFDDGHASDFLAAFPLLRARGWTAEFFVNPATIGTAGYLDWPQVREMAAAGQSFQSHGFDHVRLTRLSDAALAFQLRASKESLEDALGRPVRFLAAPFGDVDSRVVDAALRQGYRAVCTSWSWPARPGALTVSRAAVYRSTSTEELDRLLAGNRITYSTRAVRAALLHFPKRLLAGRGA